VDFFYFFYFVNQIQYNLTLILLVIKKCHLFKVLKKIKEFFKLKNNKDIFLFIKYIVSHVINKKENKSQIYNYNIFYKKIHYLKINK